MAHKRLTPEEGKQLLEQLRRERERREKERKRKKKKLPSILKAKGGLMQALRS